MGPHSKIGYFLRYDKNGVETEINQISPLLTAPEFSIDEVDEELRPKIYIMREAIKIARTFKYDMDLLEVSGLRIDIYYEFKDCLGLTDLMGLFSQADLAWISNHKRGKSVTLTAVYLITGKRREA